MAMRVAIGIDVAKEVHWVTAVDDHGEIRMGRKLDNTPATITALIAELKTLEGEITIGLDVVGGIAGLAEAMLAAAGLRLVHVRDWPSTALGRAPGVEKASPTMPASSLTRSGCAATCGLSRRSANSTSTCAFGRPSP